MSSPPTPTDSHFVSPPHVHPPRPSLVDVYQSLSLSTPIFRHINNKIFRTLPPAKITVQQKRKVRCARSRFGNGAPAPPMSSSPAWLTIALTSLSSDTDVEPAAVLASGIRPLPTPHVLHHLNRWTRHVWRPAVTARALAALTRDPDVEQLEALGAGAVSLLAALVEAIRRCDAAAWVDVLGVMFLANDPWSIDVGRVGAAKDVDRSAAAMTALFERKAGVLAEVASRSSLDGRDLVGEMDREGSAHGESFAELRCRVATLQLQLDDVTAVVRRNEKNTKDLLSSFHFWSMLLLDELRSYRAQLSGQSAGGSLQGNGKTEGEGVFDSFARHVGQAVGQIAGESSTDSCTARRDGAVPPAGAPGAKREGVDAPRVKRVFRDGKWVVL